VAIVALALWTFTVAAGVYLLITSTRLKADTEPAKLAPAPARPKDRFAPQSLRDAKSEPIPGGRALAEFSHPALAITGFAFWLLYTMVHDRIFAAIAVGVMLGAIAAGVSWAFVNGRAARSEEGDALAFSPRVLAFHVGGATLTLVLAALLATKAL
jgi:hypothetical protein